MTDPTISLILAAAALSGLMVVAIAGLKAWRDWLALRRLELEGHRPAGGALASPPSNSGARIELADLKERVRKLEAIAAGVDL
jgi:hypothetical protein